MTRGPSTKVLEVSLGEQKIRCSVIIEWSYFWSSHNTHPINCEFKMSDLLPALVIAVIHEISCQIKPCDKGVINYVSHRSWGNPKCHPKTQGPVLEFTLCCNYNDEICYVMHSMKLLSVRKSINGPSWIKIQLSSCWIYETNVQYIWGNLNTAFTKGWDLCCLVSSNVIIFL